jgi:hypothetical protein
LKTINRTAFGITYAKAKNIIADYHIKTRAEYNELCERDIRLSLYPETTFPGQFTNWVDYLSIERVYYNLEMCKKNDLVNNKHIPHDYKCNDRAVQLELLAGLIDSDGYYQNNCYEIIQKNDSNFQDIHPLVKAHWIEESGFSFPSGHSFNSWMIAVVLSYSILQLRVKHQFRKYYWIPFLWAALVAISRVMLGAHSIVDIAAGSILGIVVASGFLYFDKTRPIIFQKRG